MQKITAVIIALIFSALTLIWAENYAKKNTRPVEFDREFSNRISELKPDVIVIGNSTTSVNILRGQLEVELANHYKRKVSVVFLAHGSMHNAWQYLVLKNHVAKTAKKGTKVVIVDYEDFLSRPYNDKDNTPATIKTIKETLLGTENEFMRQLGSQSYIFENKFPYLYYSGAIVKNKILTRLFLYANKFAGINLKKRNEDQVEAGMEISSILENVFALKNFKVAEEKVTDGQIGRTDISSHENFERQVLKSFLPLIINFKDQFDLYFVISASNPRVMSRYSAYHQKYSEFLESWLSENGFKLIDLNRREELKNPEFFHDSRHLNKGEPKMLNTRLLAQELISQKVLD